MTTTMYRRKLHSSSEMRYLVNRTAIHVLSQNHRIRDKMLHACTSRGATCTIKQGRIVQTQNFIFGRFSNFFFYYPNGTWTHPPTSKLFLDFWNCFNFAKPLRQKQNFKYKKIMNSTVSPSCRFGMRHRYQQWWTVEGMKA